MEQEITLNAHNKQEYPPMHTGQFNTSSIKRGFCIALLLLCMGVLYAQDRMVPSRIPITGVLREYEDNLLDYFNVGSSDGFACLVEPSFTPVYCLTYNREEKSLILKQPKAKSLYSLQNKPQNHIRATLWKLRISDSLADSLQAMFAASVLTASFLDERHGIDGIRYRFFLNPGNTSRIATCWLPDENSNCGQAVDVVEKLCKAVRENDHEGAEALVGAISSVTNLFRQYYPADIKEIIY